MAEIRFDAVGKTFPDGTRAVDGVSLTIPDGQLVVLVGPSGCGKTTLLRMVAGLEHVTDGVISIDGHPVNAVPPKNRDIAMVFQSYALYPHMSVYDNMAFSLKLRHVPKGEIERRVRAAAETLGLSELLKRKPRQLSGGQRQRVAMGRAIVREPRAFLMDEPLSNLDAKLRVQMRGEIGRLQRELGVTTMYVTHDQTEAMTLGDLVAVMRQGVIQQVARPQELFERPANLFVAGFIGSPAMNFVEARITGDEAGVVASFGSTRLSLPARLGEELAHAGAVGRSVILGVRPEDLEDAALVSDDRYPGRIRATVDLYEAMGREAYLHFGIDAPAVMADEIREIAEDTDVALTDAVPEQCRFVARVSGRTTAREGDIVELAVDTGALHFFDPETGTALVHGNEEGHATAQRAEEPTPVVG
jgi:multiple sugar transport system ATP-binding protein